MVVTDKEVGLNMGVSGRGKYLPMKAKNKWRRRKFSRRNEPVWNQGPLLMHNGTAYEPPRLTELQQQNRLKTRRFYPRKLRAPRAPRNTSSFIMRAKRLGGLASLVSPVTPAILPTPVLSPAPRYREGLVDEVNKEWGVDGYGSMNGLIRLRSVEQGERNDFGGTGESESELEQDTHAESVQQLEQRIDHGLSRFEIVYPSPSAANDNEQHSPEVRMEELENHIAQLEDENLSLKENLYLLQQELAEARRRLLVQDAGDYGSDDNAGVSQERSGGDLKLSVVVRCLRNPRALRSGQICLFTFAEHPFPTAQCAAIRMGKGLKCNPAVMGISFISESHGESGLLAYLSTSRRELTLMFQKLLMSIVAILQNVIALLPHCRTWILVIAFSVRFAAKSILVTSVMTLSRKGSVLLCV